jgi:SAM-dependent methyltransferase
MSAEELSERLLTALTGAAELFTVELGRELGLYAALRAGPLTPAELAKSAGIDERYAREWLEQQAAAGFLTATAGPPAASGMAFGLADGLAEVLLDEGGPAYLGTAGEFAVGLGLSTPRVIEAFRTGAGIPYADYGRHIRHGIASFNRPMFAHQLTTEWLPGVPGLDARLRAAPGAQVLDLGCGVGHSSVAIALAYPAVTVRGIDLDPSSIDEARRTAAAAGVADRVSYTVADASAVTGAYDLITIFEALHDMGDPVGTLRAARAALTPGGQFHGPRRRDRTPAVRLQRPALPPGHPGRTAGDRERDDPARTDPAGMGALGRLRRPGSPRPAERLLAFLPPPLRIAAVRTERGGPAGAGAS